MRVLFVCTGNTCRSPMAEAMFRELAKRMEFEVEVRSAGTSAFEGTPVAEHAATILREKKMQPGGGSSLISKAAVDWADLVLTMTVHHKGEVIRSFPQALGKTFTLKEYTGQDGQTEAKTAEWASHYADMQMKFALQQEVTPEEQARLRELELRLPNVDISDPFGMSLDAYRRCADEIELYVRKLLQKLKFE